ncbi:MAG: four helix bundle protein [Candidatus Vogelbacteria bacterium]
MVINSYQNLTVWQRGIELVIKLYKLTEKFPSTEIYGLTSQMRRSAVSIPSNIAEGRRRGTKKDYLQFLRIAFGSGAELETQLLIAQKLSFGDKMAYNEVSGLLEEVMKMLNVMIRKMNPSFVANEATN